MNKILRQVGETIINDLDIYFEDLVVDDVSFQVETTDKGTYKGVFYLEDGPFLMKTIEIPFSQEFTDPVLIEDILLTHLVEDPSLSFSNNKLTETLKQLDTEGMPASVSNCDCSLEIVMHIGCQCGGL